MGDALKNETSVVILSKTMLDFKLSVGGTRAQDSIDIKNTGIKACFFKIQTTKRERYIIKPSYGRIEPQQTIKIEFLLTLPAGGIEAGQIKDRFVLSSVRANGEATTKAEINAIFDENKSVLKTFFNCNVIFSDQQAELTKSTSSQVGRFEESQVETSQGKSTFLTEKSISLYSSSQTFPQISLTVPTTSTVRSTEDEFHLTKAPVIKKSLREQPQQPAVEPRLDTTEPPKQVSKPESQEEKLFQYQQEIFMLENQLSMFKEKLKVKGVSHSSAEESFFMWHMVLAMIIGIVLGAFLNSNL